MRTVGMYLIFVAVVLRATVVLSNEAVFPIIVALMAVYGLLLLCQTWLIHHKRLQFLSSPKIQLAYLFLQSTLVIGILIVSTYEDFLALLFIPLSLDAISLFGKKVGNISIAIFSLGMMITFLFSDEGPFFGLAMGILYSGVCFLFGGYAYQIQKAEAARIQNQRTLDEIQTAYRQLQGYADQMESLTIEKERNRLARELHDSVTQTVFSMNLAAQSAELLLDKEPSRAAGQLLRLEELAASALHEIQSLVLQLRPRSIIEDGLSTALHRLAMEQKARSGLQVSLEIHGEETLSEMVATGLYSIAHEALINITKHSGMCEARVHLHLEKHYSCLEIEDHGRGFDSSTILDQQGHLGLKSILERAREIGWSLSVLSRPGEGTRISVVENPSGGLE